MPKHRVEIHQPAKSVMNSDVSFVVQSDGVTLGQLTVSKGSIDWRPANKRKATKMTWERFASLMSSQ